ncbi:unnamed protein product [Staurois parvus]|uniref:Uncharacterized protein n=1 Tax=Staurois parvus TaxID=386267 RepID=A0ABN9ED14_9NEOB|nr:unnamed protein product [Staurois parvus]
MGTRAHLFEWTPVPRDTQGKLPCTTLENAARTGASVPSTVAFPSAGGVPLELMSPARGSAILCSGGAAAQIFVWIRSGTTRIDVNRG